MKRNLILLVVLAGFVALGGCAAVKGFGTGIKEDTKNTANNLSKWDDWVKKNLW